MKLQWIILSYINVIRWYAGKSKDKKMAEVQNYLVYHNRAESVNCNRLYSLPKPRDDGIQKF